jgi:hypothetical protein
MFKNYRELIRKTFSPIELFRGDSVELTYKLTCDELGEVVRTERVLCKADVPRECSYDQGVIFEAETEEGFHILGGFVVEVGAPKVADHQNDAKVQFDRYTREYYDYAKKAEDAGEKVYPIAEWLELTAPW